MFRARNILPSFRCLLANLRIAVPDAQKQLLERRIGFIERRAAPGIGLAVEVEVNRASKSL